MELDKEALCLEPVPTDGRSLATLFRLLDIDFPAGARIPLFMLRASLKSGRLKGVYLTSGPAGGRAACRDICGYAVYQRHAGLRLTHILYLAILPRYRCRGLGGALMERLGALAGGRILLDAEDPRRAGDAEARETASRRMAFYRRNGYRAYPHFKFVNFGYPMRVLSSWPLPRRNWLRIYRRLYDNAYGFPISGLLIKAY